MLIEKLSFRIAVYADVRVQAQDLTTPQLGVLRGCNQVLQPRLGPQSLSKDRIFDLKAIVHSDRVALFGDPGRCGEGQGAQERDVFGAEGGCPEVGDRHDLVWEDGFEAQ